MTLVAKVAKTLGEHHCEVVYHIDIAQSLDMIAYPVSGSSITCRDASSTSMSSQ